MILTLNDFTVSQGLLVVSHSLQFSIDLELHRSLFVATVKSVTGRALLAQITSEERLEIIAVKFHELVLRHKLLFGLCFETFLISQRLGVRWTVARVSDLTVIYH
jgi:hypothetical protein